MRNRFDRQLSTLNDELIEMGSMIEKSIETAIKALVNQDVDLARHAIEADEEIDRQERIIEDLCLKLLLQQQPVASDLRLISSARKMISDMERIGDQAADIAEAFDRQSCRGILNPPGAAFVAFDFGNAAVVVQTDGTSRQQQAAEPLRPAGRVGLDGKVERRFD